MYAECRCLQTQVSGHGQLLGASILTPTSQNSVSPDLSKLPFLTNSFSNVFFSHRLLSVGDLFFSSIGHRAPVNVRARCTAVPQGRDQSQVHLKAQDENVGERQKREKKNTFKSICFILPRPSPRFSPCRFSNFAVPPDIETSR